MKISTLRESLFECLFAFCAIFCLFAVGMICFFLFGNAIPTIAHIGLFDFIFGFEWYPEEEVFGIFPMIIGSLYITALSLVFSVPLGISCAVFLSYFCPKSIKRYAILAIELLGAIPSVVYGFFGLVVLVPFISDIFAISGKSILAASIILSIMILPTIILLSKVGIDSVPRIYFEAALGLGASKQRTVFFVLVPAAKSAILASVILGFGRAIGEAMAVIMIAGNQVQIPSSLLDGVRTLTTNIVIEMGYAQGLQREVLIANALVLFVFVLGINLCFNALKEKSR
ncbi:MAG: phosphate ABC transporter permease subunit PstC [Helicobacter sp.]|nr:phosphate ABC transporter permease subunit PstC [Helicobacter sp.]